MGYIPPNSRTLDGYPHPSKLVSNDEDDDEDDDDDDDDIRCTANKKRKRVY